MDRITTDYVTQLETCRRGRDSLHFLAVVGLTVSYALTRIQRAGAYLEAELTYQLTGAAS